MLEKFKTEIGRDIDAFKYTVRNGTLGGSTERLARMIRIAFFTTFIVAIIIIMVIK